MSTRTPTTSRIRSSPPNPPPRPGRPSQLFSIGPSPAQSNSTPTSMSTLLHILFGSIEARASGPLHEILTPDFSFAQLAGAFDVPLTPVLNRDMFIANFTFGLSLFDDDHYASTSVDISEKHKHATIFLAVSGESVARRYSYTVEWKIFATPDLGMVPRIEETRMGDVRQVDLDFGGPGDVIRRRAGEGGWVEGRDYVVGRRGRVTRECLDGSGEVFGMVGCGGTPSRGPSRGPRRGKGEASD